MKVSRIAFFAALLLLFQVTVGAVVVVVLGVDTSRSHVFGQYASSTVVSICVFTYISWAYPVKPYMTAFLVGILAALFGTLASALLIGDMSWWHPATLVLDIPALLVAVLLGAGLGTRLNRRGAASQ